MPSFQDSAVIFFIALLLFGPKKLPELARYVGKLMNEFRRASSEFRMQMDDEFRQIEQAEHRKKVEAMEAAAPKSPTMEQLTEQSLDIPITPHVELDHEQLAESQLENTSDASTTIEPYAAPSFDAETESPGAPSQSASSIEVGTQPLPIASNGDLHLMPPETGLPIGRSNSIGGFSDHVPTEHTQIQPDPAAIPHETETTTHG